jgi:hypothetical protein
MSELVEAVPIWHMLERRAITLFSGFPGNAGKTTTRKKEESFAPPYYVKRRLFRSSV